MFKRLVILLLVLSSHTLYAQTVKTDVLVVGSGAGGVAASIQSARSKVKTILADDGFKISGTTVTGQMVTVEANNDISPGIWGEFRRRIREVYSRTPGYDTTENAPLKFEPGIGSSTLKKIADTVKNLTLYQKTSFTKIEKDGDRWAVSLTQDGKTITVKARIVIDATENAAVAEKAGGKIRGVFDQKANSTTQLYRTSIATATAMPDQGAGETPVGIAQPFSAFYIPVKSLLVNGVENILVTETILVGNKNIQHLPLQLQIGQAAGATAAFCAFFKTTTQHLNARTIQGELLDFKGYLLPFIDIKQSDPSWRAVQQVSATGMLIGNWRVVGSTAKFVFNPDAEVSTAEVKPVLTELYTRAFLWFNKEKPGEKFTVGNTLSFISDYTLTDPHVLFNSMAKAWKTQYKFKSDFDINRPISRREFAVLTNKFLNPFARTVNLDGRLMN